MNVTLGLCKFGTYKSSNIYLVKITTDILRFYVNYLWDLSRNIFYKLPATNTSITKGYK